MNIATGKKIEKDTAAYLLHCTVKGEEAWQEYKSSRLDKKNKGLFELIPKTFKKKCATSSNAKKINVKKEIVKALK